MNKKYKILTVCLGLLFFSGGAFADNIYVADQSSQSKSEAYKYSNGKIYLNQNDQEENEHNVHQSVAKKIQARKEIDNNTNNFNRGPVKVNKNVFYVKGQQLCFKEAAAFHNVDPWLLASIAYVESRFNPNAKNMNKNGSYDTGMMQINSTWIPTLERKGINKSVLLNPCASAYIGAWILSDNIKRYGYTWRAIGAYNSANPRIGLIYAKKVYQAHDMFMRKAMALASNN